MTRHPGVQHQGFWWGPGRRAGR